jgi:hypothetical protein
MISQPRAVLPVPGGRRQLPAVAPRDVVFAGGVARFQPLAPAVLTQSGALQALFMPSLRSIGGIIAEVTIEETGEDDLQITEHPVESGAPIADHAFKRPSQVTIRAGWSRQRSYDLSAESGVYGLLLSWQAALLPFDVYTGKRHYVNMLIERLTVTTDQHSEYALMATLSCRQVIIVGTQTTEVTGMSPDSNAHADPSSTAPQTNTGDQLPQYFGPGASAFPATPTTLQPTPTGGPSVGYGGWGDGSSPTPTPTATAATNQINANGAEPPANPPLSTPDQLNLGFNPPPF